MFTAPNVLDYQYFLLIFTIMLTDKIVRAIAILLLYGIFD